MTTTLEQPTNPRIKLSQALTNLHNDQQREADLSTARERAREQSWSLSAKIREAETKLYQHQQSEPQRLAYEFASGYINTSPVDEAQTYLDTAKSEQEKLTVVANALDAELSQIRTSLNYRQSQVHAALADLLCTSPELHQLYDELSKSWARVRGLRKALALIQHELHGNMPQDLADKWVASVTLEPLAIGVPTDNTPVEAWREALAKLLAGDPHVQLPTNI